jgi:hypothetical protein
MSIVDRNEWAQKRIATLEAALAGDVSDEQRAAIEHELAELRTARRGWRRWLWPVRLPHEH